MAKKRRLLLCGAICYAQLFAIEELPMIPAEMNQLTLTEAINVLKDEGYVEDFNLIKNPDPEEFEIDETFRFDVMTDPGDQSVLYAMHSKKTGAKGVLINGFGIYSDAVTNKKMKSIH